jgi:uncharacterized alpha/beta hydrolase family protein
MKKYKVTLYVEQYTEVEVEASSEEEAEDMVISGDYSDEQIIDTTVKESDVVDVRELV